MPEINENGETVTSVKKTRKGDWIKKEFSASVLLFFIKGHVSVDYRGVHITEPNTMLGVIPAGSKRRMIPLQNISEAQIDTAYKMSRFVWGVILALIGIVLLMQSPIIGLILALLGVVIFANGILTTLVIEKNGPAYVLSVPFFNKADIISVKDVIDQALEASEDKTDQSLYHHRLSDDEMDDVQ